MSKAIVERGTFIRQTPGMPSGFRHPVHGIFLIRAIDIDARGWGIIETAWIERGRL